MWIFSFYSLVDGVFVAKGVGEHALAAVNLSMPYINTVFSFGIVFAAGSSIVISIFLGQKNGEKANQYFNQNIVVVAALCVAFSIFTLLNMDFIVDLLGATGSTREYVKQYITVIAPFVVFYVVSYNLEVLVKTDGSPHVSILGVFTCAMTNVVLDYVFVIRFHWGVPGAAVATGIAQALSTVIFLLYFWKRGKHLQITKFKFDFSIYKRV
ncbi:MAG: MATE family efflux transporter, partial [Oscillibacter sp.]